MTSQIVLKLEDHAEIEYAIELLNAVDGTLVESRTADGKAVDTQKPRPEFDPITALLIGGAALAIARFTVGWLERRRGGVVVDLRPGAESEIRRSTDLPYGWLLIFPRDNGALRLEVKDEPKDWTERILEKIIDGTLGTVHDIAAMAKERLKGDQITDEGGTPLP